MKLILALLFISLLSGCSLFQRKPDPVVIKRINVSVTAVPEDILLRCKKPRLLKEIIPALVEAQKMRESGNTSQIPTLKIGEEDLLRAINEYRANSEACFIVATKSIALGKDLDSTIAQYDKLIVEEEARINKAIGAKE